MENHNAGLVLLLLAALTACAGGSGRDVTPSAEVTAEVAERQDLRSEETAAPAGPPFAAMFDAVLAHLAEGVECTGGDWAEDFGDSSFYGICFPVLHGLDEEDVEMATRGLETAAFALSLLDQWKGNPGLYEERGDDLIMGTLGLLDVYDNFQALDDLTGGAAAQMLGADSKQVLKPRLTQAIDAWNAVLAMFGYYAPDMEIYAIYTYGNTVVTALFGLMNVEYVRVMGAAASADQLEAAEKVVQVIEETAWDDQLQGFRKSPAVEKLHLYPNAVMMLLYGRLYKLTGKQNYLDRSIQLHAAIQPLKDAEQGAYHSPYSMDVMGAQTDDYKTLSSQLYTALALMTLYENTGGSKWLDEAGELFTFVETYLYVDGKALHHWMDGEIAKPEHLEYYCSGCNFQLLYALRLYRQMKGGGD